MQTHWQNMWSFETARFRIAWDIAPDEDCDTSFDETGETAEKVNSGEWSCFVSRMVVELDGREIACDYLGGSIYANPAEFRDHIGIKAKGRADGHNYGSYFSDMVRTAIGDARKALGDMQAVRLRA